MLVGSGAGGHAAPALKGGSAGAAVVKEDMPGQRMHALPACLCEWPSAVVDLQRADGLQGNRGWQAAGRVRLGELQRATCGWASSSGLAQADHMDIT